MATQLRSAISVIHILNKQGLDQRIANDPRLSVSQVDAMRKVAKIDREAGVEGLDQKMRPVISAKLGPRRTRYALLRNGDPVKPNGLCEPWDEFPEEIH